MTTDPLGIITDVNQQMEALTGYTPRGADRLAVQELLHRPEPRRGRHPAGAARGQGHQLRADRRARRTAARRSSPTTPRRSATPTGKLQGVFAAARDITEQKKLEEQLRESQAYNRGLIEASVDGLITVDPAGIDLGRQRADVPHVGLLARGADRHAVRRLLRRRRPRHRRRRTRRSRRASSPTTC